MLHSRHILRTGQEIDLGIESDNLFLWPFGLGVRQQRPVISTELGGERDSLTSEGFLTSHAFEAEACLIGGRG